MLVLLEILSLLFSQYVSSCMFVWFHLDSSVFFLILFSWLAINEWVSTLKDKWKKQENCNIFK